jgi:hypothetical protein
MIVWHNGKPQTVIISAFADCFNGFFRPGSLQLYGNRLVRKWNLSGHTIWFRIQHFVTASVVEWSEFLATDPKARVRFPALPEKKVVGLERGPLSLVSTTEELLNRKVAVPV